MRIWDTCKLLGGWFRDKLFCCPARTALYFTAYQTGSNLQWMNEHFVATVKDTPDLAARLEPVVYAFAAAQPFLVPFYFMGAYFVHRLLLTGASYFSSFSKQSKHLWNKVQSIPVTFPHMEGEFSPVTFFSYFRVALRTPKYLAKMLRLAPMDYSYRRTKDFMDLYLNMRYSSIHGETDDFLLYMIDLFDYVGERKYKLNFLDKLLYSFRSYHRRGYRSISHDLKSRYSFLLPYFFNNKRDVVWRISRHNRELADLLQRDRSETYVFHALLSTALCASTKDEDWKEAVRVVREAPVWERIGETRQIVRVLRNSKFLSRSILFKESKNREGLATEFSTALKLEEILKDDAIVPQPLYLSEQPFDGRYVYVMRFLDGPTLLSVLKKGKTAPLDRIVRVLAKSHDKFPPEDVPSGRIDIADQIALKVQDPFLGFPEDLQKRILNSVHPIIDYFRSDSVMWFRNNDFHLENIIISRNRIGLVDCETKYLVPAQYDLVNLLEYGSFFDDVVKNELIGVYLDYFGVEDRERFMLGYYLAMIVRMLCFASAWSDPGRPSMAEKRFDALRNARLPVRRIKEVFPGYYAGYADSFICLDACLGEAAQHVVQKVLK